jgi:hypothetical protein
MQSGSTNDSAAGQSNSTSIPNTSSLPLQNIIFSKFPELPLELQQMIRKAALPKSRVILLEHKERHFDDKTSEFIPRIDRIGFRSDTPAPSILLACREAYAVACLGYSRAFTNRTGTSIPEIYFDFAK